MAPTLATKSQKPRPELTRRRLALRFHAASERTTACCQPLCSQQTAVSSLPNCCSPSKQRRKLRRVDQVTASARDCRRAKLLGSNRRSCALKRGTYLQLLAFKSLRPWPQLWPHARSKSLQPSAPRPPAPRAKTACEAQARETVPV